jgi:hypothetical protein
VTATAFAEGRRASHAQSKDHESDYQEARRVQQQNNTQNKKYVDSIFIACMLIDAHIQKTQRWWG